MVVVTGLCVGSVPERHTIPDLCRQWSVRDVTRRMDGTVSVGVGDFYEDRAVGVVRGP